MMYLSRSQTFKYEFIGENEENAKGAFWKHPRAARGKFACGKYCEAPLDSPKTFNKIMIML